MAISTTVLKEEAASAADVNIGEATPDVPEVLEGNDLADFLSDDADDLDLDNDIVEAIEGEAKSEEDPPSSAEEEPSDAKVEPEPKEPAEVPVEADEPSIEAEVAPAEPAQEATPKPEQQADTTPAASAVEEPIPMSAEQVQKMRTDAETMLSEHYKMTEEQVTQFELNPEQAIPQLAARIYMDAVTGALQQVQQALPNLLDSHTQVRQASDQNEEAFFSSWPQLKTAEANPTILRIGQVYRQLNPQASAADFIRDVGAQAMVSLRISPENQQSAPDVPKVPAFKPAGSSPRRGAVSAPDNVFAALSDSMDAEDLDLD